MPLELPQCDYEEKDFSPSIHQLLTLECQRGNRIEQIGCGFGGMNMLVMMCKPFMTNPEDHPDLKYLYIKDPHYWLAEYTDPITNQTVAFRFAGWQSVRCTCDHL